MGQLAKHKGPVDQGVCPDTGGHTVTAQDSIPVFRKHTDKCLEVLSATYSQMIQREKDVPSCVGCASEHLLIERQTVKCSTTLFREYLSVLCANLKLFHNLEYIKISGDQHTPAHSPSASIGLPSPPNTPSTQCRSRPPSDNSLDNLLRQDD